MGKLDGGGEVVGRLDFRKKKIRWSRIYTCICIYTRIYVYVLYTYTYMCVYIHTDISTVFSHFDTRFTLDEGLVGVNSQGRNWPGSS